MVSLRPMSAYWLRHRRRARPNDLERKRRTFQTWRLTSSTRRLRGLATRLSRCLCRSLSMRYRSWNDSRLTTTLVYQCSVQEAWGDKTHIMENTLLVSHEIPVGVLVYPLEKEATRPDRPFGDVFGAERFGRMWRSGKR